MQEENGDAASAAINCVVRSGCPMIEKSECFPDLKHCRKREGDAALSGKGLSTYDRGEREGEPFLPVGKEEAGCALSGKGAFFICRKAGGVYFIWEEENKQEVGGASSGKGALPPGSAGRQLLRAARHTATYV